MVRKLLFTALETPSFEHNFTNLLGAAHAILNLDVKATLNWDFLLHCSRIDMKKKVSWILIYFQPESHWPRNSAASTLKPLQESTIMWTNYWWVCWRKSNYAKIHFIHPRGTGKRKAWKCWTFWSECGKCKITRPNPAIICKSFKAQ